MKKFIDCDVIAVLYEIMIRHTEHYQNDFDVDIEIITDAADSNKAGDKKLLWFSRSSGTTCVQERNVYIKDTYAHNTWVYYGDNTCDPIKAYAVEISGAENGKVIGDLYELDYLQHFRQIKAKALPIHAMQLTYKNGEEKVVTYGSDRQRYVNDRNVKLVNYLPKDNIELNDILGEAQAQRHNEVYEQWDLQKLKDSFIRFDSLKKLEWQELRYLYDEIPMLGIYQLKGNMLDNLFVPLSKLQEKNIKVKRENYNLVYVEPSNGDEDALDGIYDRFNLNRPKDFYGHSLSVSDVVVLSSCGESKAYYVDNIGFQEIPNFMTETIAKAKGESGMEM